MVPRDVSHNSFSIFAGANLIYLWSQIRFHVYRSYGFSEATPIESRHRLHASGSGPKLMDGRGSKQRGEGGSGGAFRHPTASASTLRSQSTSSVSENHPPHTPLGRPGTPSSSQSGNPTPWDPVSYRCGDTSNDDQSSSAPSEYWPRSDSSDPEDGPGQSTTSSKLRRATNASKPSGTTRFFRAILQRFGRSYNKKYDFLPNDRKERNRNELQHQIFLVIFDGRIHLAPIAKPRRVLDLGTGPGSWALEFAKRHPKSIVLGIDIEPVVPPFNLPNCRFQVMDFADKWSFDKGFDFVHLRMLGSLPRREVFAIIFENLNPGGWAEFTEWIALFQSPHASFSETSLYRWNVLFKRGMKQIGQSVAYPEAYRSSLRRAGFVNITERKYAVPINAWPPGKSLQKLGAMMMANILDIVDIISLPIFTNILGWSPEALENLLVDVRKEVQDPNIHTFMTLMTVYGQKAQEGTPTYPTKE